MWISPPILLEANGLPAGSGELTQDVAARVMFVAPGGPKPLPTSSPALIAGCLTRETGSRLVFDQRE